MLSLLSSEWDEVGHMRMKHQHIKVRSLVLKMAVFDFYKKSKTP